MKTIKRALFSSIIVFSVFAQAGYCEIELIRKVKNQEVLGGTYCVDVENPKLTFEKQLAAAISACKKDSACIRVQDGASAEIYFKKRR